MIFDGLSLTRSLWRQACREALHDHHHHQSPSSTKIYELEFRFDNLKLGNHLAIANRCRYSSGRAQKWHTMKTGAMFDKWIKQWLLPAPTHGLFSSLSLPLFYVYLSLSPSLSFCIILSFLDFFLV